MNKEELKSYLKENLKIEFSNVWDLFLYRPCVTLKFEGEEISRSILYEK